MSKPSKDTQSKEQNKFMSRLKELEIKYTDILSLIKKLSLKCKKIEKENKILRSSIESSILKKDHVPKLKILKPSDLDDFDYIDDWIFQQSSSPKSSKTIQQYSSISGSVEPDSQDMEFIGTPDVTDDLWVTDRDSSYDPANAFENSEISTDNNVEMLSRSISNIKLND